MCVPPFWSPLRLTNTQLVRVDADRLSGVPGGLLLLVEDSSKVLLSQGAGADFELLAFVATTTGIPRSG